MQLSEEQMEAKKAESKADKKANAKGKNKGKNSKKKNKKKDKKNKKDDEDDEEEDDVSEDKEEDDDEDDDDAGGNEEDGNEEDEADGDEEEAGALETTAEVKKAVKVMTKIHPDYRKQGMSAYICLVLVFVIFSVLFIALKAAEVSDPPITVDFETQDYDIPTFYFCPNNVVRFKSAYCDVDESFGSNSECSFEVFGADEDNTTYPCIAFKYTDSSLESVPGLILLELYYEGTISGLMEVEMTFGDDLNRIYYIGVGQADTFYGISSNVVVERVEKKFLDEERNVAEWRATVSPTSYAYASPADGHQDIACGENLASNFCDSASIATCSSNAEDSSCAHLMVVYLQFQTRTVEVIKEVNPLNAGEIIGVLGGYWVYVGAAFGLCFAIDPKRKSDVRLYPSQVGKKVCCINN